MMRTEAPKDLEGRGVANLARTTPELPVKSSQHSTFYPGRWEKRIITVRPGNLAPDHADLGAADLLLAAVDIGDALAKVEAVFPVNIHHRVVPHEFSTYLAAAVSSTPSILIKLVLGWVV